MEPLRALIIDDCEDDAWLVAQELGRRYAVTWKRVDTAEALRAALARADPWDLITCDYVMPQLSAEAALQVIRRHDPDIPVIVVSGEVGEEVAVGVMKAGAQDFVSKHRLARLLPAVERELREVEHRRARRHAETQLRATQAHLQRVLTASPVMLYCQRSRESAVF
jgi:DNA-binding NtrC family response regulator